MTAALERALRLAGRKLPVFPCRADKAPACTHGFKDATADAGAVRALWRFFPGPLIGVPTGPATFDALDIDPRHGGDAWLAVNGGKLPTTRVHLTRSGGQHFLFRHRAGMRNSEGKIASGVDVRGDGGYVIWWPGFGGGIADRARLADWPDWLAELAMAAPPAPSIEGAGQPIGTELHATRMAERVLTRLRTASAGQRHYALRAAARTLGGLMGGGGFTEAEAERELLAAVLSAGGTDIREGNARATIRWGLKKGASSPLKIEDRRCG